MSTTTIIWSVFLKLSGCITNWEIVLNLNALTPYNDAFKNSSLQCNLISD